MESVSESEAPAEAPAEDSSEVSSQPSVTDEVQTPGDNFSSMVSALPADLRDHPSMSDLKDFEGLAKSYVHSQSMLGRDRIEAPNEKWTDEEWSNFYGSLGRPDEPDGYSIAKMEDFDAVDPNNMLRNTLLPAMHEAGLSEAQATQLATAWTQMTEQGTQALAENTWEIQFDENFDYLTKLLGVCLIWCL